MEVQWMTSHEEEKRLDDYPVCKHFESNILAIKGRFRGTIIYCRAQSITL
jgi:hypothetical protein